MRLVRPEHQPVSLEELVRQELRARDHGLPGGRAGLTEEELATAFRIWREFTAGAPRSSTRVLAALAAYRAKGGAIVVASHSEEHVIRAHYRAAGQRPPLMPDLVFGWEVGPDRRKPHPFPVHETLRQLGLEPRDVLVVDDLKPGIEMAAGRRGRCRRRLLEPRPAGHPRVHATTLRGRFDTVVRVRGVHPPLAAARLVHSWRRARIGSTLRGAEGGHQVGEERHADQDRGRPAERSADRRH